MGDGIPDVLQSTTFYHPFILCRLVHHQKFYISGEALLPVGVCVMWLRVTMI